MVVLAGAETCHPALPAAGEEVPTSTAGIEPVALAQFSGPTFAGCVPPMKPAQPPVLAGCPLQVTTVYSAAPAGAAQARTATRKRKRTWTLVRTVARTRGAASSFSPGP